MTQEEKAKAYDEAIERAKKVLLDCTSEEQKVVEYITPELKESEDERIRKSLIGHLKECRNNTRSEVMIGEYAKWIAWLEKQGEQKPTDKVEPKFKIGDFIVNDYCIGRIVEITNDAYLLDTEQGIPFSCHSTRLWDVTKDAKDGDVVASDNSIFIFKEEYIAGKPTAHCGLMNDLFVKCSGGCWTNEKCYPATKEQRDLLFQKMHEAGYEWDAEKKELKKISQCMISAEAKEAMYDKPVWSEEDERYLNIVSSVIGSPSVQGIYDYHKVNPTDVSDWLKSLKDKVQPKPAWNEEDENMLQSVLWHVSNSVSNGKSQDFRCDLTEWLKSLRPQKRWKPSEEQMKALKICCNGWVDNADGILESLYNNLKNLKG